MLVSRKEKARAIPGRMSSIGLLEGQNRKRTIPPAIIIRKRIPDMEGDEVPGNKLPVNSNVKFRMPFVIHSLKQSSFLYRVISYSMDLILQLPSSFCQIPYRINFSPHFFITLPEA